MMRVANAPCSWGVLEFQPAAPAAPASRVLDEIAVTGYAGTELGDWGFLPTNPLALRDELAARGLALAGAFVAIALANPAAHEPGLAMAVRTARLLADAADAEPVIVLSDENASVPARTLNAGRIGPEHGLTEAHWDTFAHGAERVARAVRDATGLRTAFHPHCAGYVETPDEIDALLARADPRLLGLCLDTGHITYAGGDPLDVLQRYQNRLWHVHLKDCDPAVRQQARESGWDYHEAIRRGVFCELGKGCVDLPAVLDVLDRCGYAGWMVVEQDVLPGMGTPAASARRSREYLRALGV
jgi:inosose dehydratase